MEQGRLILASSPTNVLVHVGNAACWGAFVLVWLAAAIRDHRRGPRRRAVSRGGWPLRIAAFAICAAVVVAGRRGLAGLEVGALWVRILGLALLVGSTAFAFRARFALGTMWSADTAVKEGHELRTGGPYAVTRHPIYTGMLGMLAGSTLLSGAGRWIFLVPLGLVVLGLKAREEERLMTATFPDAYPAYRRRVPALVPGLRLPEGRPARSTRPPGADPQRRSIP